MIKAKYNYVETYKVEYSLNAKRNSLILNYFFWDTNLLTDMSHSVLYSYGSKRIQKAFETTLESLKVSFIIIRITKISTVK